ncbi:Uncharacterised protein [[Eubacterium] contortum]|uniref:Regulator of chromosome condensation (RCC1) repeat-containing protein n=1 Tax=Faecalicatena contorta TaxID=39482 RepID=A0A174L2A9_9FIRM|nr:hypothetical protein [Faecalicatena contorta]CUP18333.1 Uncharacterised protein [[Eubacterium] contortum] [Faecalicatena contorta]
MIAEQIKEEYTKEWFVYDTVPQNLRKRDEILNQKRGIWAGPLTSLGIILIYFLLFAWLIPKEHFQIRYILLLAVISEVLLTAVVRISVSLQKSSIEARIKEFEEKSLKGQFNTEYILIRYFSGAQECYYYNDLPDVEENADAFQITGPDRELRLDKRYLSRDDILYVRNQMAHYCRIFREYEEKQGGEKVELKILHTRDINRNKRARKKNDLLLSLKYNRGRGYSEWRRHILGAFLTSLFCMCVFLPDNYNVFLRIVVAALVLFRLFVKVFPYITVSIKLRGKKSVDQTDIIINENGIEFLQGNKRIRQTYESVKEIREEESSFYVGRVYFWKDSMTTEEISAVRNILKKYGRGKYQYIVKEGTSAWKEDLKTAIVPFALLVLGVFMFVYRDWMIDAGKVSGIYQRNSYEGYIQDPDSSSLESDTEVEGNGGEEGQSAETTNGTQENKDSVFVSAPDKSSLHLSSRELRLDECYSDNTVNQESRFFIENGTLFGISANRHGELGIGNTESDLTAKGFYRITELAPDVQHVAQGSEFMVYLNNNDELWGAGNLPGTGQSLTPALIMENVAFADCSEYGLVILKNDGTVWCMGSLLDSAGNPVVSWDGAVQVADHARYVTAGCYAMAAIREDDSLWMWGDNRHGQCGGSEAEADTLADPKKVRDGVKAVWIDRLAYRDYEEYPLYGAEQAREYMDHCTYIQQTDGQMYACGMSIGGSGFVAVVVGG